MVRADGNGSDVLKAIPGLLRHGERDAPVDRTDVRVVDAACGGDILASREDGRGTRARIFEEGVLIHRRGECPAVDGCDLLRDAERFVAVVRDEDGGDVLRGEYLAQDGLDLPFEMRVERGERLVEEQDLRAAREDARECDTLLLSAGQPCGIGVFKALQGEPCDVFGEDALLFRVRAREREDDVLAHGHVRKEGVVLKEVADVPLLRREVDALRTVEERAPVEDDASAVRVFKSRDAFERHALAAARCAEEGEGRVPECEIRSQREIAQLFLDVYNQLHQRTSLLR